MTIFSEVMVILVVRNEHFLGDTLSLAYSKQWRPWHQKHPFSCNLASDLQNVRNPNGRAYGPFGWQKVKNTPTTERSYNLKNKVTQMKSIGLHIYFLSLLFSWNDTDRPRASFHWHSAESCIEKKETSNSLDEARYYSLVNKIMLTEHNYVLYYFKLT